MKLAEYQDLYYVKKVDFGVYLAEDMGGETHVLGFRQNRCRKMQSAEGKDKSLFIKSSKNRLCRNQHIFLDWLRENSVIEKHRP